MNAVWFVLGVLAFVVMLLAAAEGQWALAVGAFACQTYVWLQCIRHTRRLR